MATDTVSSDHHSTTVEPVEKKVNEEIETTEEDIPPSKEDGAKDEEENPKAEESTGSESHVTKIEETADDRQMEPPVIVEVVEKVDAAHEKVNEEIETTTEEDIPPSKEDGGKEEEEKPKAKESTGSEPHVTKIEETVDDKQTEPRVVIEKVDAAPVLDVSIKAGSEGAENIFPDHESSSTPEPEIEVERLSEQQLALEAVENQPEERPAIEAVEKQPEEQPVIEEIDKQPEDKPAIDTVESKSSTEAIDKPVEHLEVSPVKDSVPEVAKQPEEVSEVESKLVENPESVTEVEERPREQSQVLEEVEGENEEVKPRESLEGQVLKDEGTNADKCEGSEPLKEEKTSADQEPVAIEETQADPKEVGGVSSFSDVVEKAVAEGTNDENGVDVVKGLVKDETVLVGKEEGNKEKNVKVGEETEEKNAKMEESIQTETTKIEEVSGSDCVAEVAENSFVVEQGPRDVDMVIEKEKEETVKEDIPSSVETSKNKDVKVDEVDATSNVNEPLGEPKESNLEVKAEETGEIDANRLESTQEAVHEIANSHPPNLESSKDDDDTKTSMDLLQEVSVKPTQKQSGNIISKVKQSIVKVKKAIIGKSSSSKTLLPEAKGDEKVK